MQVIKNWLPTQACHLTSGQFFENSEFAFTIAQLEKLRHQSLFDGLSQFNYKVNKNILALYII
ncbi:hypothetical protein [Candidatus Protochlamydia amoebophila]|uniref:Uncharacterized protein n=1 Tax=Candidatus Protochlamydia amoebophila TaxID=362787 RepID=A0A0C1JUI3_9BACT|nr:hypothetical protein [Candidatus Protochlamydia amoebophila]KIC70952.1 hypothetical protein DB44_FE00030 [Candidatus Protochlamydia amoebophila]